MQRLEELNMKSIIEGDIAYLQGLLDDIEIVKDKYQFNIEKTKLLKKQAKLIERQQNALQSLINSNVLPRFYISCETFKRYCVKERPPKAASNETEKYLYFAKKEPRQQDKLQSTSFNTKKKVKQLPETRLTIQTHDHQKVMTLTLEHADKYPKGGNTKKVKKCVNEDTGMTYALKKYRHRDHDSRLQDALTSSYFAAKMERPDYVIQYGTDIYFLTCWYEDIKTQNIKLKFEMQLKSALSIAYEIALLHNDDVVSFDLKPGNMIRTTYSAHTIDHDGLLHLKQVEKGRKIAYTTRFFDDSIALKYAQTFLNNKGNFKEAITDLKQQAKRADVYGLGFLLGSIFTDLFEFNTRFKREDASIRRLIDRDESGFLDQQCARRANLKTRVNDSNGNRHSVIQHLILRATHQDAAERPADATKIYNALRSLATETYGLQKHDLPPELPAPNSEAVYNDLEAIVKKAKVSSFACLVNHFNHRVGFHSLTSETAVQFDYQTIRNLAFVKRLYKLQNKKLPMLDLELTEVPLQPSAQVDLTDEATLRRVIKNDGGYLVRLQKDIDTKTPKGLLLHRQFVASHKKMLQTLDAKILPRYYVSLATGETFAHFPAPLKKTSDVTKDDFLVGIKEPRARHKLFDAASGELDTPDRPTSILKLQDNNGKTVLRLALEHLPKKANGLSAYVHGGFSSKVKCGIDTNTRKKYAVKQYSIEGDANQAFRLAQSNQYFSRRLGREAYTCLFAGKLYFVTEWIESIPEKLAELSLEQQLKYALWAAYEIARLHKDDVLLFDIKIENFIFTETRAELIDMENFIHRADVVKGADFCWSPISLDHTCAHEFFSNFAAPTEEFAKQKKRFDVYALGITLGMILSKLKTYYHGKYESKEIAALLASNPKLKQYNQFSGLESTPLAAQHKQLDELISKAINQDSNKRFPSAVELYNSLRDIATSKYKLKKEDMPPTLPFLSNSNQVHKDLQAINSKTFNPMAPTVSHLNQTESGSDMTVAEATRYQDYQTFQNAKMRQQIAAHAGVIKSDVINIELGKDKEEEGVTVNERPFTSSTKTDDTRTSVRSELLNTTRELSELLESGAFPKPEESPRVNMVESYKQGEQQPQRKFFFEAYEPAIDQEKINEQFKKLVRLITERAPNMNKKHAKYKALKDFNKKIQDHDITREQLPKLAKIFLHLGMSHVRDDLFQTTEIGKDCRMLLNHKRFKELRDELFQQIRKDDQPIRYQDMRTFVRGANNAAFFNKSHTATVLDRWSKQFESGGNINDLASITLQP